MPGVLPLSPELLRRILVVKLSSLGDVVRVTGVLASLRAALPRAEIVMVTGSGAAPLLANHPAIDRLLVAKRAPQRRLAFAWEAWRRLAALRLRGGFDLALDLQGSTAAAVWSRVSGARVKARRGDGGPGWATYLPRDMRRGDTAESFALLRQLGLSLTPQPTRLVVDPKADAEVVARLRAKGLPERDFILVSPFSLWVAKDWPVQSYAALLPRLAAASGRRIVLSGARGATAAVAMAGLTARLPADIVAIAGDLRVDGLTALIARAGLVISGDSGPMHVAAAFRRPQVALFGPTWPERSAPDGWDSPDSQVRLLQRQRFPDFHAYQRPESQAAMAAIAVEDVLEAALSLLRSPTAVGP